MTNAFADFRLATASKDVKSFKSFFFTPPFRFQRHQSKRTGRNQKLLDQFQVYEVSRRISSKRVLLFFIKVLADLPLPCIFKTCPGTSFLTESCLGRV